MAHYHSVREGKKVTRIATRTTIIFWLAVSGACTPAPQTTPKAEQSFRLFFIAELRGELEPCGCTLEPLGGLARLASYLKARQAPGVVPVLIAHGDLISPGKVRAATLPQVRASGVFLQESLLSLGLAASGSGDNDDQLDAEFDALETVKKMPWLRRGQSAGQSAGSARG
jgi:hypothetical protein